MSGIENVRSSSSGVARFVFGGVLLVLGVVGIITTLTLTAGSSTTPGVEGTPEGGLQGLLVVASAVCIGVGALLIVLGIIKRKRRDRGI